MKVCKECGVEKALDQYYKHSRMADGHLNKCIECVKSRVSKHRSENIERIREYDSKRANWPERVAARKEYAKTEAGKLAHKRALQKYHERFPLKAIAHYTLTNAVRDGKIKRQEFCSECSSNQKVEAHHDDYTKPLDVRWLCEKCHKEWHRHNKPIYE
jgi:ribosomal protein S27AE